MKTILRYVGIWLTVLALLAGALTGLFLFVTNGSFVRLSLCGGELAAGQRRRIDEEAALLAGEWGLKPETLTAHTAGAAERQNEAVAQWWDDLWHVPAQEVDPALPYFVTDDLERTLVESILADDGFTPTDRSTRKADAREIAYQLDQIVTRNVTPLRASVVDLAVTMAVQEIDLPQLRSFAWHALWILLTAAILLIVLLRRSAGSVLLCGAGAMVLASMPVWLMNTGSILVQLNPDAAQQAQHVHLWLAIPWYGAALLLAVSGLITLRIKDVRR